MEGVGIFYGHLVHCTVFCYNLRIVIWYIFSRFGILNQEKSGNPDVGCFDSTKSNSERVFEAHVCLAVNLT
jgi:hypothetical protein